jgi:hypothetical protein
VSGEDSKAPRAADVVRFHDACLDSALWPGDYAPTLPDALAWAWVAVNHAFNTRLWREEDLARRRDVPDGEIAANKRAIDHFNQQRNDAVERCDEVLVAAFGDRMDPGARLHSETPGMMIDRLSILALKVRAMGLQAARADAGRDHRDQCAAKLATLLDQRADLAACLDAFIADCRAGRARFKVYRQFKMYNDPALNPSLYSPGRCN